METELAKLELGCGFQPTPGFAHHDRKKHSPWVEVVHDLDVLPWPWADGSCEWVRAIDVFEHLHVMPEAWMRECHRILAPGGTLHLQVPIFGSPWHLMDPTHVRGFHPANFDYFVAGKELHQKFGRMYFDFAFRSGETRIDGHNIVALLTK